jgi:hypothetical protein
VLCRRPTIKSSLCYVQWCARFDLNRIGISAVECLQELPKSPRGRTTMAISYLIRQPGGGRSAYCCTLMLTACTHVLVPWPRGLALEARATRGEAKRRAGGAGPNCPGRNPKFWAVKRAARSHKCSSAIESRFATGNAKGA